MGKQIELEIRGVVFVADMLEDKAPKSCKAILNILPFEGEGYHQFWSGQSIQIHSPILGKSIKDNGLWPAASPPEWSENPSVIGCPGELALYPHGGGLFINFGKSLYSGDIGPEPSYHFAKITKDLDKLYEVGRTFRREGAQKIKIYSRVSV